MTEKPFYELKNKDLKNKIEELDKEERCTEWGNETSLKLATYYSTRIAVYQNQIIINLLTKEKN